MKKHIVLTIPSKRTDAISLYAQAVRRALCSGVRAMLTLVICISSAAVALGKAHDLQASYDPRSDPGSGQKFLEKFTGEWSVEKIFHPLTGGSVSSKGECHQMMINGGRFLKSEFVFFNSETNTTGLGLIGFAPDSGLFTSIWTDSRSTKMSIRQSKAPFDGIEIVMFSMPLPNGGHEARPSRNSTRMLDGGRKIVHQQYAVNPDNTERLMMELILTKKSQ